MFIQEALSMHFPYMNVFMPFFLLVLGHATTSCYFNYGMLCAIQLNPKMGRVIYFILGTIALYAFSFVQPYHALLVMSMTGGILLLINTYAVLKLRHEIKFSAEPLPEDSIPFHPTVDIDFETEPVLSGTE